jgi:Fe-S-cluster containining protein
MKLSWCRNAHLLWAARGLGREVWLKIFRLARIYQELDSRLDKFRGKTGLGCLPGCGKCCVNPYVETSVPELIPVAAELWRRGRVSLWLRRVLDRETRSSRGCVFYRPHPFAQGQGRCGIYPLRPLTCRLYGFSARRDKTGQKKLEACSLIRASFPGKVAAANEMIGAGLDVPVMALYRDRVRDAGRGMDTELYSINTALRRSIERIGLARQLHSGKSTSGRVRHGYEKNAEKGTE